MNKAICKWHIWNSLKKNLPLCWDGQVLVFDTKESAIDFLHSAIAHQEDLDRDFDKAIVSCGLINPINPTINATYKRIKYNSDFNIIYLEDI